MYPLYETHSWSIVAILVLSNNAPHTKKHCLSQNVIIDCKRKKKKKSFELQERGTALKNKGDRWQYITFHANEKKKSTN